MLAAYGDTPAVMRRLRALLPEGPLVDSWEQFERVVPGSSCAVIAVTHLATWPFLARFHVFRRSVELVPILLVTRRDAENLRQVRSVPIQEVIWLPDLESEFPKAVEATVGSHPLAVCADRLERTRLFDRPLASVLAMACRANPPITTVEELARLSGRDRRTLADWWAQQRRGGGLRLKDVLDRILLVRALGLKRPGRSWAGVAAALGIHEDTIFRIAMRGPGLSRGELTPDAHRKVAEGLRRLLLDEPRVGIRHVAADPDRLRSL